MNIGSTENPYAGYESTSGKGQDSIEGTALSRNALERPAKDAAENLKTFSRNANEKLKVQMDNFNTYRDKSLSTSRNYVREHPLKSTAMAMVVGMLLRGMLSRRSKGRTY